MHVSSKSRLAYVNEVPRLQAVVQTSANTYYILPRYRKEPRVPSIIVVLYTWYKVWIHYAHYQSKNISIVIMGNERKVIPPV